MKKTEKTSLHCDLFNNYIQLYSEDFISAFSQYSLVPRIISSAVKNETLHLCNNVVEARIKMKIR
jgi:hypothetical protein